MTDSPRTPIFIVGCHSSGTTPLRLMLDSHPHIACGPETRFLPDFAHLTRESWGSMSLYGFPKEYWHQKISELFDGIKSDYASSKGKPRWADKTPRYALSLDYIDELFPTCQIIHVIRDGRDVVASHKHRWGYLSALKAIEKWPHYIRSARAVGNGLPAARYREVRYERLVNDTETTMRELLDFLGEPWDPAVLEHDQRPHDISTHYGSFSSERRETAREQAGIYRSRVGAHRKEMGPVLRILFHLRSGDTLRELGYA
jgi:Sulfotransferase family